MPAFEFLDIIPEETVADMDYFFIANPIRKGRTRKQHFKVCFRKWVNRQIDRGKTKSVTKRDVFAVEIPIE